MLLERERGLVAAYGARMVADGLVVGSAGNLSVRSGGLVAISPTGVRCDDLDAPGVVVVDPAGEVVDGGGAPSSELPMHLAVYAALSVDAIVHTHSPYATALATAGIELPPIHYAAADLGGTVRVASYATFGTELLADAATAALAGRTAVLLERHGVLTVGETLEHAYARAADVEWLAALYVRASALAPVQPLDAEELARLADQLERRRASRVAAAV